jgi:hypothetical protein
VGIYLSQLPAAELARLKAELAETLIANFCYPRFFDYRTNSLRMRPVDRSKRQEVWLFLGNMDFSAWNRIDLLSPDFQRQIERLFIHFVQRNRSFFGEQGRKRMADVRMLINTSSQAVIDGFRGHLTSRQTANPPFGSPRPVSSWAMTNVTGRPELKWEQIVSSTMLVQQQIQELRGEIKPSTPGDARPAESAPKRVTRGRSTANRYANGSVEPEARPIASQQASHLPSPQQTSMPLPASMQKPETGAREESRTITSPSPGPKTTNPLAPPSAAVIGSPAITVVPPVNKMGSLVVPDLNSSQAQKVDHIVVPASASVPGAPAYNQAAETVAPQMHQVRPVEQMHPPTAPAAVEPRELSRTIHPSQASLVEVPTKQPEGTAVILSDEDLVIFEQMRYQLLTWLRIEAIHAGLDISGQGPGQLLELLKQQDGFDDTRLQVVSTLLNISNQVIVNGRASLLDYKQAMMFYLMHTRRSQ